MTEEEINKKAEKHCNDVLCNAHEKCNEVIKCRDWRSRRAGFFCGYEQAIKDFEKELNKANKWHYVKDGDLPKGEGAVLIYWKSGDIKCASVVEPYKVTEDTHIIAWKEIELPKEKEND